MKRGRPPTADTPLSRLLQQRGMTQTQLAKLAGLGQSRLSRLAKQPDPLGRQGASWRGIARALGMELWELLRLIDSPKG